MTPSQNNDAVPVPSTRGVRFASILGVSEAGRALRDFATYLPTQALPALAAAAALPVLARHLSPTDMGVLAIAQNLITLGWTAVGSWLAIAIVRELPAHRQAGELGSFSRTLRNSIAVSFGAYCAFVGITALVGIKASSISSNFVFVAAGVAGFFCQYVSASLFAASLRPRAYAVIETCTRVGGILAGIFLVLSGRGVHGYLTGLVCISLAVGGFGLWRAWPRPRAAAGAHAGTATTSWMRYGIPASAAAVMLWGLNFVDRYILAALRSAGAAGVYTVGNTIGDRLVMVPMFAFGLASTPLLVHAFEQHGRLEVERLMRAYTRIVLLVGIPCIAFAWAAGGALVDLIAGYNYVYYGAAARAAPIVALGSLMFALASLASTGLIISKHARAMIVASAIGFATNVVANLALIPHFGVIGAAVATPIGMGVYLACAYALARHHASWRFPLGTLVRALLAGSAGYIVAVTAVPHGMYQFWKVILYAAIGLATYLLVLVISGERRAT